MYKKVLIHAAYPKTASTWFQTKFYPQVKNYTYIPRNNYRNHLLFSESTSPLHNVFEKYRNENIIICEEGIMNIRDLKKNNPEVIAHRLAKTFPQAQIIIFIRNQIDLLISRYSQYIRQGGTATIEEMIQHLFNTGKIEQWKYYDRINLYNKLFGQEAVKVYLYEEFNKDKLKFLKSFSKVYNLEIDLQKINFKKINKGYNKNLLEIIRHINMLYNYREGSWTIHESHVITNVPFLHKITLPFFRFINKYMLTGKRIEIKNVEVVKTLKNYFKDSNRKLQTEFNLNLEEYNYPL